MLLLCCYYIDIIITCYILCIRLNILTYCDFQFFNVAPTMQLFKEANIYHDLNDADGSIKFCKRVNALITAMNSRTPENSLRLDNEIYKVNLQVKFTEYIFTEYIQHI